MNFKKRLRSIWKGMKERCYRESHNSFKYYGAKGVKVCPVWLNDFNSFYYWSIQNGYANNLVLDRKESNLNYEPSNCRWITQRDNLKYRKGKNAWVMIKILEETKCLADWAKVAGVAKSTIYKRYKKGLRGLELIKQKN